MIDSQVLIETAVDFQEKNLAKLKSFQAGERKLSSAQGEIDLNNKANFKNIDHIMDKKLILLVNDPNSGASWELPKIEWKENVDSLRDVCCFFILSLHNKFLLIGFFF